jgi:hypothetical protein
MVQTIHIDGQSSGDDQGRREADHRRCLRLRLAQPVALPYLQVFTVRRRFDGLGRGCRRLGARHGDHHRRNGDIDLIISPPIIVPNTSDGVSTAANTAFATCSRRRSTVRPSPTSGRSRPPAASARRGTSRRSSWCRQAPGALHRGIELRHRSRDGHLDPLLEGFGHLDRRPRPPLGLPLRRAEPRPAHGREISGS